MTATGVQVHAVVRRRQDRDGAARREPLPRDDVARPTVGWLLLEQARDRRGGAREARRRTTRTTRSTRASVYAALYFARNVLPGVAQGAADRARGSLGARHSGRSVRAVRSHAVRVIVQVMRAALGCCSSSRAAADACAAGAHLRSRCRPRHRRRDVRRRRRDPARRRRGDDEAAACARAGVEQACEDDDWSRRDRLRRRARTHPPRTASTSSPQATARARAAAGVADEYEGDAVRRCAAHPVAARGRGRERRSVDVDAFDPRARCSAVSATGSQRASTRARRRRASTRWSDRAQALPRSGATSAGAGPCVPRQIG